MKYTNDRLTLQPWLAIKPAEARATVQFAAYCTYWQALKDGHAPNAPLQTWQHAVSSKGAV